MIRAMTKMTKTHKNMNKMMIDNDKENDKKYQK